ncbi:hypothetical protein Tco_0765986 [Tanacetum coccineum]
MPTPAYGGPIYNGAARIDYRAAGDRQQDKQSHDEVYGCLKGGSGNSGGNRLAISMVEKAWLSEKEEV